MVIICKNKIRHKNVNVNAPKIRDSTHTGEGVRDEPEIPAREDLGERRGEV